MKRTRWKERPKCGCMPLWVRAHAVPWGRGRAHSALAGAGAGADAGAGTDAHVAPLGARTTLLRVHMQRPQACTQHSTSACGRVGARAQRPVGARAQRPQVHAQHSVGQRARMQRSSGARVAPL